MKYDIFNLTREQLRTILKEHGFKPYRADILYKWMYEKLIFDFYKMTDIAKSDREKLHSIFSIEKPTFEYKAASKLDNTRKYALSFNNEWVESVLIPSKNRLTQCISSQTGCKLACRFCATGENPGRNLSTGEIIRQYLAVQSDSNTRISNIVFMGMGEPLLNTENVLNACRIFNDEKGIKIGARRITISTAGIVPGIREVSDFDIQVKLAVSLNSAVQKKREYLMPVARKHSLHELKEALLDYQKQNNRRITFEYIIIPGFNDKKEDSDALLKYLEDFDCKINLIPYNPVKGSKFRKPSPGQINDFKQRMYSFRDSVSVRRSMGTDIDGACGQLKNRMEK